MKLRGDGRVPDSGVGTWNGGTGERNDASANREDGEWAIRRERMAAFRERHVAGYEMVASLVQERE